MLKGSWQGLNKLIYIKPWIWAFGAGFRGWGLGLEDLGLDA